MPVKRAGLAVTFLLLVLVTHAVLQPPGPPEDTSDPATSRALAYLLGHPPNPETVEAFVAAGIDPKPLVSAIHVPAPDPTDPNAPLRELHALLRAGVRVHQDPDRGPLDLADELRSNHEFVAGTGSASTLGFWLLSAHALQWNTTDPDVQARLDELVASQRPDGGFPCLAGYSSLDCTGFAIAALAAHNALGRIDQEAALGHILAHGTDGGYTDGITSPNAQSTAWAMTSLRHLGDTRSVDEAESWLRALQQPDGSFARAPGTPGATPWWTTAEVVVALRGGHPIAARPAS